MILKCTAYQIDTIKSHTKDMDTNNFNIIQRVGYLITDCLALQNENNELIINKIVGILSEVISMANANDLSRLKINDILNDFEQEVK